jgi:hypothetical protein
MLFIAACEVAPTASPITRLPSTPPASAGPLPIETPGRVPTPVPGAPEIGADWKLATLDKDWRFADIARGPDGWLAGGSMRCREPGCGRWVAATWFSADGFTWTGGPMPDGRHAGIGTVASDGDRWFAVGSVTERVGDTFRQEALIWRSSDARSWTLVGSIPLGVPEKGLGPIGELAAGPGGVILGWVDPGDDAGRAAYWSQNGESWQAIDKGTFGLPRDGYLWVNAVKVVDGRFVMHLNCECGTVWSSSDGRRWRLEATLGPDGGADFASDGRRMVIAGDQCEGECRIRVVTSADGRTDWRPMPAVFPAADPLVTYAAETFIVAGFIEPNDDPQQGAHIFTSADGRSWTELVEPDFRTGDCWATGLEGAEDRAMFLGRGACEGVWVSLAPGAG